MEIPYEVLFVLMPTKKEREEGIGAKLLTPTPFLALVEDGAGAPMAAGMAAVMDEATGAKLSGIDRTRLKVFARPFAQA